MSFRAIRWSIAVLAAFVIACTSRSSGTSETRGNGETPDAGASTQSFDPRGYSTACVTKAECMLAPIITGCRTCCSGDAPVNATAVHADLEAARQACGGGLRSCLLACEDVHAECVEQQCISCTERVCRDGVLVKTSAIVSGKIVFEGNVDGNEFECTFEQSGNTSTFGCSPSFATSTMPPVAELIQEDGLILRLFAADAKSITLRAIGNGTPIGETTFAPTYATEPGPNGPQCEPKTCVVARTSFP